MFSQNTPRLSRRSTVPSRRWLHAVAVASLVSSALPLPAGATQLASSPWPMLGHDAKHTFRSSLVGPATNVPLPETKVKNYVNDQAAVTADGIFAFGAGFYTWGIRADGVPVFKTRVGAEATFSSPALDSDGFLYVGGRDNQLWKKSASDGIEVCKRYIDSDSDIKSSPTISSRFTDRVYVVSAAKVYAIGASGPEQCNVIWEYLLDGFGMSSVSIADSTPGNGDGLGPLIVASNNKVFALTEKADGSAIETAVSIDVGGYIQGPTPVIDPSTGAIFVGDWDGYLHRISPDLSTKITRSFHSRFNGSVALSPDGSALYALTQSGEVHKLSTADLSSLWPAPYTAKGVRFKIRGYAPVVDGEGTVYFGGSDRKVRAVRADGTEKWAPVKIKGQPASATIVDGGLALGTKSSRFYRFCPPPTGPANATQVCGFTVDTTVVPPAF